MTMRAFVASGFLAAAALLSAAVVAGATATAAGDDAPPEFTESFLTNPGVLQRGEEIWQEQCRHCHGHSAYPGKAPKLTPRRYKAGFVYDRVTNGFRKMPAWKEQYDRDERMSVSAYVLSPGFSP